MADGKKIWIGGLRRGIEEEEIRREMEPFGEVVNVSIRSSPKDTFAFVQFGSLNACERAIDEIDTSTDLGENVKCQMATQDSKRNRPQRSRRDDSRDGTDDRRGGDRRGDAGRNSRYDDDFRHRDYSPCVRRDFSPPTRKGGYSPPSRKDYSPQLRKDYSPQPRRTYDDKGYDDRRPRSRSRGKGGGKGGKGVPQGRHKITIENLPDDMSWLELKDLGRQYGPSLTFSRTYVRGRNNYGMLEFADVEDAEMVVKELNDRRVQGSRDRLYVYHGTGPDRD